MIQSGIIQSAPGTVPADPATMTVPVSRASIHRAELCVVGLAPPEERGAEQNADQPHGRDQAEHVVDEACSVCRMKKTSTTSIALIAPTDGREQDQQRPDQRIAADRPRRAGRRLRDPSGLGVGDATPASGMQHEGGDRDHEVGGGVDEQWSPKAERADEHAAAAPGRSACRRCWPTARSRPPWRDCPGRPWPVSARSASGW